MEPDTKQNSGIIIGIIAVLAITLIFWLTWSAWNERQHNLDYVLDKGGEDIMAARVEFEEECRSPRASIESCENFKLELLDMLTELNADIAAAKAASSTASTSPR